MKHILEKKPSKRTRRLKREEVFASGDEARMKRLLGRR
jgi:ribosomal protein L35